MRKLLLTTAVLCASGVAAQAQDIFRPAADATEIRGTDLIGMRVYASEAAVEGDSVEGADEGWEDVGEVNDIVLSREGSVDAVLVDIGGFLGIGERQVAVSMGALRFVADGATAEDADDFFLVMNASRAVLEGAPEYGVMDAAATDMAATETVVAEDATADPEMVAEDDAMAAEGAMAADDSMAADDAMADDAMATDDAMAADGAMATEGDLGSAVEEGAMAEGEMAARTPVTREGYLAADMGMLTADTLQGAAVYDSLDERIGEVSELQLSAEGQVEDVVIDVGGFLGIGEKPVLLPMDQIDILQQDGGTEVRVYLSQTKEDLEAMATYEE